MSRILNFYLSGEYYRNNPTWDASDTDWKFGKLVKPLETILPQKSAQIVEIGCGSGELLKKLSSHWPEHQFKGFDIAPDAKRFWNHQNSNLSFAVGDFLAEPPSQPADVVLLIDVLEHLADPVTFLERLSPYSKYIMVHLPLDMTVVNILFDQRILRLRDSIGHIHYFTKAIGEKLILEGGYKVLDSFYSRAWKDSPNLSSMGKALRLVRAVLSSIDADRNAKILGGETLLITARSESHQLQQRASQGVDQKRKLENA